MTNRMIAVAVAATLASSGMVALVLFEVMRALASEPLDLSGLPPVPMLVGFLCASSLIVLVALTLRGAPARWVAFGIGVLLVLFHAIHVVEHLAFGDLTFALLILFMMFAPSAVVVWQLWQARREGRVAIEGAADGAS